MYTGCLGTPYVEQTGFRLTEICLFVLPEFESIDVYHRARLSIKNIFLKFVFIFFSKIVFLCIVLAVMKFIHRPMNSLELSEICPLLLGLKACVTTSD